MKEQQQILRVGGPPWTARPACGAFPHDPSRGGKVAEELVGDFKGYLQTDGYAGYNALGQRKGIIHVGCLAYVRRKFLEVHKGSREKDKTAFVLLPQKGQGHALFPQLQVQFHLVG